jgi:hypothetical protein
VSSSGFPSMGLLIAVHRFADTASSTVTTFGGDPALAKSDPSNVTGLVVGILTTLVVLIGALVIYLRNHRRA